MSRLGSEFRVCFTREGFSEERGITKALYDIYGLLAAFKKYNVVMRRSKRRTLCLCVCMGGAHNFLGVPSLGGRTGGRGHLAICVFAHLRQATWRLIIGISRVNIWVIGVLWVAIWVIGGIINLY